jgi:hypothetical protein
MTTPAKLLTILFFGAIFLAILSKPAGFAAAAASGGSVLDNTLSIESGAGTTAGQHGSVTFPGGASVVS